MPQVAFAISGIITAIGGGTFAAAAFGVAAATAFEYAATAFILNKAIGVLNKRGKTGESRGLEVSIADTNAEARIIYGEVRVGGVHMIPGVSSGTNGEFLHMVLAIAAHEIDSYQEHYIDQDVIPAPASITGAAGDGLVGTGAYALRLWIRGYTGTMSQNVDYILNAAYPSQWASTARGRGFAYIAYKFAYSKGEIYKSIPVPTAKVRGAKVYDPRLDSTNGGSGSHRYATPSTWAWSSNPALCWANYRMMDYGYDNDPATMIDWTTVAAAADVCDALVADKDGGTQKRYTCNGLLVNGPENLLDNEQKLIDSMLGHRTFVGGKYQIYAGAWETPGTGYTIAKSDWLAIDSIVTVSPQDQSGRFSEVHCFFVDPDRNWQRVECYVRRNATYLADDAGYPAAIEMEQPLCTDESEAQRKAEFILRQSRNGVKLVGSLPPRFQFLKTFKTVALTFAELGWTSKTFRIVAYNTNMDGSVQVALTEEQSGDWTDLVLADYGVPSTNALPDVNPTAPTAPQGLAVTVGDGLLAFTITPSVIAPIGTRYLLLTAANCANPTSASYVWEGDALNAFLPFTETMSGQWWWAQAYAPSATSYSGYYPSSYGVFAVPTIKNDLTLGSGIADGKFISGYAIGSYWVPRSADIGASYLANIFSLSPTGGVNSASQGALVITGSNNLGGANWKLTTHCRRRPWQPGRLFPHIGSSFIESDGAIPAAPGMWVNMFVQARRRTGISCNTVSGGALGVTEGGFHVRIEATDDLANYGSVSSRVWCPLESKTLDEWTLFAHSVQLPNTKANWVIPSLRFGDYAQQSGTIEVGMFDVRVS